MDPTLQQLANDLRPSVAHCPPAAALVERVATTTRPQLAILHVPEAADLHAWVAEQFLAADVVTVALDEPATHGTLDTADVVLLAFPCGALPTVELLTALVLPLQRPVGTYAAVLTGAEQITSADDLALVERTALRWLLPPESTERRAAGGFLWATPNVPHLFAPLCDEERHALATWLTAPRPATVQAALAVYQLQRALDLCADQPSVTATPTPNFHQQDADDQTRQRLLTRFRSAVGDLEQQALDAVNTLEASLFSTITRDEAHWSSLATTPLTSYVAQQVHQSASRWYESTAWSNVENRRTQIERHLAEMLADEIGVTTFAPKPPAFDRATLRDLYQATPPPVVTGPASRSYSKVLGAALATPLVALAVGLGPLGAVVATGVTTVATYGYEQATHPAHPTADVAHYLHETYATYVQAVRGHCLATLQTWAKDARQEVATLFDHRAYPAVPTPTVASHDLASFRQRLAAFVARPS